MRSDTRTQSRLAAARQRLRRAAKTAQKAVRSCFPLKKKPVFVLGFNYTITKQHEQLFSGIFPRGTTPMPEFNMQRGTQAFLHNALNAGAEILIVSSTPEATIKEYLSLLLSKKQMAKIRIISNPSVNISSGKARAKDKIPLIEQALGDMGGEHVKELIFCDRESGALETLRAHFYEKFDVCTVKVENNKHYDHSTGKNITHSNWNHLVALNSFIPADKQLKAMPERYIHFRGVPANILAREPKATLTPTRLFMINFESGLTKEHHHLNQALYPTEPLSNNLHQGTAAAIRNILRAGGSIAITCACEKKIVENYLRSVLSENEFKKIKILRNPETASYRPTDALKGKIDLTKQAIQHFGPRNIESIVFCGTTPSVLGGLEKEFKALSPSTVKIKFDIPSMTDPNHHYPNWNHLIELSEHAEAFAIQRGKKITPEEMPTRHSNNQPPFYAENGSHLYRVLRTRPTTAAAKTTAPQWSAAI